MMMLSNRSVPIVKAWGALLTGWIGLTLALGALVETGEARVLLPVLAALVAGLGLWRPRPYAGLAAGGVAAALFVGLRVFVEGPGGSLAPVLVAPVVLLPLGFFAESLARRSEAEALQRQQDAVLIEELTPTDGQTGALKWQHAQRHLADELTRARRYLYPMSFVLLGVEDWAGLVDQRGVEGGRRQVDELIRLVVGEIRPTDRVSRHSDTVLALMLPHTPLDGALVTVDRLRIKAKVESGLHLRAGIAEFPTDGATADELTREAEAALEFARASSLGVASRDLLGAVDGRR